MSAGFRLLTFMLLHAVIHLLFFIHTGFSVNPSSMVVRARIAERKNRSPVPYGVSEMESHEASEDGYFSAEMCPEKQRDVKDSYESRSSPNLKRLSRTPVVHTIHSKPDVHYFRRKLDGEFHSSTSSGGENILEPQVELLENQPKERNPIARHRCDPGTLERSQDVLWYEAERPQNEVEGPQSDGHPSDHRVLDQAHDVLRNEMKELRKQIERVWSGSHNSNHGVLDWGIDSLWGEMEALNLEIKELKSSLGHNTRNWGNLPLRNELEGSQKKRSGIWSASEDLIPNMPREPRYKRRRTASQVNQDCSSHK